MYVKCFLLSRWEKLEKEGDKLVFLQTILMSTTMNYSKLARGHYIFLRDILD